MNKQNFLQIITPAAQKDMQLSGILASVTIAQAALESAWGSSVPGNNLFGIKGAGQQQPTSEYMNGQWIRTVAGFRVYDSWLSSIRDHSQFLLENRRYADIIGETDYRKACKALQRACYATDPNYAAKLINIIETNGLAKYDTLPVPIEEDKDYMMTHDDANKIIGFLSAAWKSTDIPDAKKEFNRLANEIRKASGQQEE